MPPLTRGSRNRLTSGRSIQRRQPHSGSQPSGSFSISGWRGFGRRRLCRSLADRSRPGQIGAGQRLALEHLEAVARNPEGRLVRVRKNAHRSVGDTQPLGQQPGRKRRPQAPANRYEHPGNCFLQQLPERQTFQPIAGNHQDPSLDEGHPVGTQGDGGEGE